ncbi:hypothetical protein V1477_002560 [Vespula maculifrons]|uniref:Uncharacterized protein n=1 Tax=Vespula maculifrons TaxID=7453 RepID=A0ABD2CYC1_VESMC
MCPDVFENIKRYLCEQGRIFSVLRSELTSEKRMKHDYGFVEIPNEYTIGAGFRRVRGTDTVSASALPPTASAGLRCSPYGKNIINFELERMLVKVSLQTRALDPPNRC